MTYQVSQEFKDFIIALKAWVDEGCPEPTQDQRHIGMGFRKDDSICFQIGRWTEDGDVIERVDQDLQYLLREQFEETHHPFNNLKEDEWGLRYSEDYNEEIENKSHYENPKRLKWINDTVASFEEKANEPE